MSLSLTPEEKRFRDEVRAFIAAHLSPGLRRASSLNVSFFSDPEIVAPWQNALHERGWVAPGWPQEHGGPGWSAAQRWIFESECARAGAPQLSPMGIKMVGPVLMRFGTAEQKKFYLPRILSGEDRWCQGYSEPGSGSDLASLKTRAARRGECYIVNGTKIWTTHAHFANRMFALVRTSDEPRKQDGISFLLIDMKSPGITIRPIMMISGDHDVNQVFFDDVEVPVANLVGEEGRGWTYGKYLLEFERGGGVNSPKLKHALEKVRLLANSELSCHAITRPEIATKLSEIELDLQTLEFTELKVLSALQRGENPGPVSSILKLRASEIHQAITRAGVEIIGQNALVEETRRPLHALADEPLIPEDLLSVVPRHLNGRANTIFGGSSEIQRDIIARQVLGL
ncbi:acyl-CoA dehydrogenase family protein [Bradyrhizobium sp. HKCCYLRH1062]|uniref:acyl-CoA dehydrogenase family protein n=1 Tax=unclassified Bradyrhizobium TaxID=2631580 RepID=UPI003EB8184F